MAGDRVVPAPAERSTYRRLALVLDDEFGQVGGLALRLVRARVDTLYAADVDEAVLLARQERGQIGAVVVPVARAVEWLPLIEKYLELPPAAVVPMGERPGAESLAELRGSGLRWALWNHDDERAMHFVVTSAMSETDETELRFDLRVPTRVEARLVRGVVGAPCTVRNLSEGGALVAFEAPVPVGEGITLEFCLEQKALSVSGEVRWAMEHGNAEGHGWWMGVQFGEFDGGSRSVLSGFLGEARRIHRL